MCVCMCVSVCVCVRVCVCVLQSINVEKFVHNVLQHANSAKFNTSYFVDFFCSSTSCCAAITPC